MKKSTSRKVLCVCLIFLLFVFGCLGGYFIGKSSAQSYSAFSDRQALNLTVQLNSDSFFDIPTEETGGNFSQCVQYRGVKSVSIEIDGQTLALEEALSEGLVNEEELFYLARTDARNGFCEQVQESKNGLTHYTFRYPEYNLRIVYDIYETPDGQQHLISDLCIYDKTINLGAYVDIYDKDTGKRLDLEDWGIEMEITDVTSTGLTLTITQTGGQQIGDLYTFGYALIVEDEGFVTRLDASGETPSLDHALQMEGITELTVDWTDVYGELPSGEYELMLDIIDRFDEDQVHPLMVDYHDWQVYTQMITIP